MFDHIPNTSKFVKNTLLYIVFSTLFLAFGNVVKHGLKNPLGLFYWKAVHRDSSHLKHCSYSIVTSFLHWTQVLQSVM